jgi:hypothetical protein
MGAGSHLKNLFSQNSEFSRSSECEFLAQISSQLNSHYEKSPPTPS